MGELLLSVSSGAVSCSTLCLKTLSSYGLPPARTGLLHAAAAVVLRCPVIPVAMWTIFQPSST